MRKAALLLVILIFGAGLSSCIENPEFTVDSVFALDTVITLKVARNDAKKNIDEALQLIDSLEKTLSRTAEGGALAEFNSVSFSMDLNDNLYIPLRLTVDAAKKTGGAFDPTLALVSDLWGITSDSPRVPSDKEIAEALSHCGLDKLKLDADAKCIIKDD